VLYDRKETFFIKVFSASVPAFAVLERLTDAEPLPETFEGIALVFA